MNQIASARLQLAEILLKSLIQDIGPNLFSIALNNACRHGTVFIENFVECLDNEDYFLNEWFVGIEKLHTAAKKADTSFYDDRDILLEKISEALKRLQQLNKLDYNTPDYSNYLNGELKLKHEQIVLSENNYAEPKDYIKYLDSELKAMKKVLTSITRNRK